MAQYTGTVKWFNNAKGYGFLGSDSGPDVFVHYSAIQMEGYKGLKEGEPVEFDVVQGESGRLQADRVRRTSRGGSGDGHGGGMEGSGNARQDA